MQVLPIQFIFLLIIVSLPGQLAQTAGDGGGMGALPALRLVPAWVGFGSLFVSQALLVLVVVLRSRKAIQLLHEPSAATTPIAVRLDQFFSRARWASGGLTAVHLFCTPIAGTALGWFAHTRILKYLLLPELLFLLPAVLAWVAFWIAAFHVEVAIRERKLPYQLARQQPVHEMPGLGAYLKMQVRHNFYPFLFLLFQGFVTALAAALSQAAPGHIKPDAAEAIATFSTGLLLLATLPFLLTRIWSTVPLEGPLRERLDAVARRNGLRFSDILLWRSHNMLINAAIVGWLPRGRYFLMSDALVESFSDDQLESVFAHEVGHGIHHHLHWLMLAILSAVGISAGLSDVVVAALHLPAAQQVMAALVLSSVLLCVLAGGAVYLISPRFEHQADWFACRHMALRLREQAMTPEPAALAQATPAPLEPGSTATFPASMPLPFLATALAASPTPGEAITLEQYKAGRYPHNPLAELGAAPVGQSDGSRAIRASLPEIAGAEVFISALDSIIETAHRDRARRGWFHPSVANRVALLRQLAQDPLAESRFNRKMRRTRYLILILAAGAAAAVSASFFFAGSQPQTPAPGSNANGSQVAALPRN